jgi:hypothetical protein
MSPERNNQANNIVTTMPIQGNFVSLQNEVDQNSNTSPLDIHPISGF